MTTNAQLLADLEKLGGAGHLGADRIRMLDEEILALELQLAVYRKSEPEYQAQMKWARDVVSNVVIPPAAESTGPFKSPQQMFEDDMARRRAPADPYIARLEEMGKEAAAQSLRLYTGDEIHGFMLPDYRSDEPRWIDAKTGLHQLIEALAAWDCIRDEPNCGSCLSCQAKTLLGRSHLAKV